MPSSRPVRTVLLLVPLLFSLASFVARAQDPTQHIRLSDFTTEGREFWVVFQKNFRDYVVNDQTGALEPAHKLNLELFITSSENTTGYIEIKGIGLHKDFRVPAGEVINIPIDTAAQLRSSETVEELGVHIVADQPIAVYGLNRRYQTTDTYLAYPVNVLGTTYRALGYHWLQDDLLSQVAVIATQNNTRVTITPTVRTLKGRPANKPFEVTLQRGQAYQVIPRYDPSNASDLTGTLIEADAPVAVFSGHNCAYVPDRETKACNLLVEQLPAVQSWGRQFFVGTLALRSSSVYRVLASEDGTQVFENNRLVATLDAGEYYENPDQKDHVMITSSHPVMVAQYSEGFDNGDNVGDPMMIVVAPTEQFLTAYRFATPVRGAWHHYINVIVPTESLATLQLDGNAVDRKQFTQLGLSRYSIAQIEVSYGTHVITNSEPFGLYSYGFGYNSKTDNDAYDAYGNGGGQSMDVVVEHPDTIAPSFDAKLTADGRGIDAVARDDRVDDEGMLGVVALDFENLSVDVPEFEPGAPQVPVTMRVRSDGENAFARFRLRDRAGHTVEYLVCARFNEATNRYELSVLDGSKSCDFSGELYIGGLLSYAVVNNHVSIDPNEAEIGNPVRLDGNVGEPVYGIHAYGERYWTGGFHLTGRAGLTFFGGNAVGYWPDSSQVLASDGTVVNEEFRLRRMSVQLTLAPGLQYYLMDRRIYGYGLLNLTIPIYTSETFTRTILSPANYVYDNGEGQVTLYDGGGPGFSLGIIPEVGLGFATDLRLGWRVFGEIGAGYGLTSISGGRAWTVTYIGGRLGAKLRF